MLYKNEGVDSKELRRRREEEDVQLRKQKREMRVSKNRNIDKDNVSVIYFIDLHSYQSTSTQ